MDDQKPVEYKEIEETGVMPKEDDAQSAKILSQIMPFIMRQTEMIFNQIKNFRVGGENKVIRMSDQFGLWAGHAQFSLAPFKVSLEGVMTHSNTAIAPTLLNSWVNYGSPYSDLSYCKNSESMVMLRGSVKNGSSGVIFTLPDGYRPSAQLVFPIVSNNAFGRIDIGSDGNVVLNVGTNASVALDGITFSV